MKAYPEVGVMQKKVFIQQIKDSSLMCQALQTETRLWYKFESGLRGTPSS